MIKKSLWKLEICSQIIFEDENNFWHEQSRIGIPETRYLGFFRIETQSLRDFKTPTRKPTHCFRVNTKWDQPMYYRKTKLKIKITTETS